MEAHPVTDVSSIFGLPRKVAIVTGASRGIGKSAASILARLGARVVVSSRDIDACSQVVKEIEAAGGEAFAVACNISRREDLESLVTATIGKWGKIDFLVCNAAVNPTMGPLAELREDVFDKILSANVKSTLWLCNLALPHMAANGGGSVVIVSSVLGIKGSGTLGAYGISKAADFALARNLAVEWGPRGIRVNSIAPGLVQTDFAKKLWEDADAVGERNARTPLRRIGQPDEIGSIIAFLGSPAASFITGQVIVADGGVTIV
ncbi:MAG: SDR family oxidoreductase [Mesorhizobium sp.]|nr:SDR family oxidoreductase [Mesorhizobium sp.]